ncbi:enoyl-CoA hydratase/isomerase family protein [Massilia sp. YMA4]|uniref:Enoyl-CoA hydratase/isomerase family protein n=1 Tax=[Empedobacter] haloabium TaxID=592317 RepID=A0ABZ1UUC0_9BURK|nr:enoyl-CoA hydratase/isomerase family protein [Massilia sp. YMA4]AXA90907.1 enoyl-CoA hydratase/isomerase family protein [Massilia sp. YMA4]
MLDILAHDASITELRIARPPINLIDVGVLRALRQALAQARDSGQRGVLLSGAPGVFSAGVDIAALLEGDRADVREYWQQVFLLAAEMARSPVPIFAAVTGHCMAAGALLAVFCDYRVMARGAWHVGLNEVRVGVALPECFHYAVRRVVGALNAERLLVFGRMLDPVQALDMGLVDELADPALVVDTAASRLRELLALPRRGMFETRAIARNDLASQFADIDALPLEAFVDAFLQPETQAVLRHVAGHARRTAPAPAAAEPVAG